MNIVFCGHVAHTSADQRKPRDSLFRRARANKSSALISQLALRLVKGRRSGVDKLFQGRRAYWDARA